MDRGVGVRRIVVLGMGRSGTSFLTRFLAECGVYVDEVSDKYEHSGARRINEAILQELFGARPGRPYGNLPEGEIRVPVTWHARATEFIEYMDGQASKIEGRYWAFKDPRTTILHSLWVSHFDVIVGIFRAPEQVVESMIARGWISGLGKRRIALSYWLRFNKSLMEVWRSVQGSKPMYVVDYNADIDVQMSRLCRELGIPMTEQARGIFRNEDNHYSMVRAYRDPRVREVHESLQAMRNVL